MAKHLAESSYDVNTLNGTAVLIEDGCYGVIRNVEGMAVIRQLGDIHKHEFHTTWPVAAWEYIDKGKRFPIRQSVCSHCNQSGILMDLAGNPRDTCESCTTRLRDLA